LVKVILNKDKNLHPNKYKKGDIADIPKNIAERWVNRGIAHWPTKSKTISFKLIFESIKFSKPTSIIILTINKLDMLKGCLDSIHKYTNNYELIIIGNNPTSEVKQYLESLDKFDLKLVINKENKGFPYACNQGIKIAKYNYICFLNDDTLVTPNWLYKLQKAFGVKKDCGFSSPTTCYSNGTQCDWKLAKGRFSMSEAEILDYSAKLKEEYTQTEIYGFCMLTKKSILKKVGVFDWHRYGLGYTEEVDLMWRAGELGYKSYWVKGAYVHHFGHQTFDNILDPYASVRENRQIFEKRKKDKNLFIENDVEVGDLKTFKVKKDKKISVIIPVLDRKKETIKTLKSLFENNSDIDVWIVDNGSEDISYLKDYKVRIIKNKDNLGTIKAINQGLKFCQSEYIVIMHNDIVINTKNWISKSVKFMKENFDVGMIGAAGWEKIKKNGIPDYSTTITAIDKYNRKPKGDFGEVSILDGCCIMIKNINIKLDEDFGYMHYYDLDLSMQYKQRGFRLFVMNGRAKHFAEDPKKSTRANKNYLDKIGMADNQYYQNNRKIFLDKWRNYLPMAV